MTDTTDHHTPDHGLPNDVVPDKGMPVSHSGHNAHSQKAAPHSGSHSNGHATSHNPYMGLLLSLGLSFVVMYAIMYSMVDRLGNVYFNLSNVYMTGLMAGSMLPIMLVTMGGMFKNKKVNSALWVVSVAMLALFWGLLRRESGVGDRQFLRAMIPHHAAAIQMAQESSLTDPRINKLAQNIITAQEQEIAEMKAMLAEKKSD